MIKENINKIKSNIPADVTLIAVSKYRTASEIMEAYDCGIRDFGENHINELLDKYDILPKDIKWHMIGHIQSNKFKKIIGKTYLIHSVDSIKIGKLIDKYSKDTNITTDILLEVNIACEESKTGFNKEEIYDAYKELSVLENINIKGLMVVAPNIDDENELSNYFKEIHEIGDKLNKEFIYSCGMSNDYKIAIKEETNYVRIGTAIFGERNYNR